MGPRGPFPDGAAAGLTGGPLERQWLHYALLSRSGDVAVIANLSTLGADRPDEPAHRRGIVLAHDQESGWEASQFNARQQQVPWSSFRLPQPRAAQGGKGPFNVAAVSGSPALEVTLRSTSQACTSQCAPFGDGEFLRWQSEPGVLGAGMVTVHGRSRWVELTGYHERVRGRWSWPALGGWVFGFVNAPHSERADSAADSSAAENVQGPPPAAVVFTLIQPRFPDDAANGSVMLWREGRLWRHFPRRCLQMAVDGALARDDVVLVPPLAGLLDTPSCATVPGRLVISARMGQDHLLLDFTSRTAGRIANPCERGLRPFSVHETLGPCRVEARVSGRHLEFETQGIVEFAGGADDL
ncbi:hypothetical protein [Streptomyces sp. NRRL B-1140]|uniref:hypothetical protein n=1 Tax=Streptomyces sp. NRRL B-1140 TaxID=1415549 RepID=UPI000B061436|nr:hypothetical protein [Streptomyces sp. NRRL B-1140]